jgi:hypothetical protein
MTVIVKKKHRNCRPWIGAPSPDFGGAYTGLGFAGSAEKKSGFSGERSDDEIMVARFFLTQSTKVGKNIPN